jgi:hypothetical protein
MDTSINHNYMSPFSRWFLILLPVTFTFSLLFSSCECEKGFCYDTESLKKGKVIKDFDSSYYIQAKITSRNTLELLCDDLSGLSPSNPYIKSICLDSSLLFLHNKPNDSLHFVKKEKNVRHYYSENAKLGSVKKINLLVVFARDSANVKLSNSKNYVLKKYRNYRFGIH